MLAGSRLCADGSDSPASCSYDDEAHIGLPHRLSNIIHAVIRQFVCPAAWIGANQCGMRTGARSDLPLVDSWNLATSYSLSVSNY